MDPILDSVVKMRRVLDTRSAASEDQQKMAVQLLEICAHNSDITKLLVYSF